MTMMCALILTDGECPVEFTITDDGGMIPVDPCLSCEHYRDINPWDVTPGWTPVYQRGLRGVSIYAKAHGHTIDVYNPNFGMVDG